jgi:hypothetical protein
MDAARSNMHPLSQTHHQPYPPGVWVDETPKKQFLLQAKVAES